MMSTDKAILVLGATGQQGGATARHLLAEGCQVRALTRDTTSTAAQALARAGVFLIQGDMADRGVLDAALQGAYGVFSVQPPTWAPTAETYAREVMLGRLIVDAAKAAGVQHFVYTSVLGAEQQAQFGRTNHKREIETYLWESGLPATILRPAGFMENFFLPAFGLSQGSLFDPTAPHISVPLIAVEDIGALAVQAFNAPDRFLGQTLELAGDRLTPPQMAATLSSALGHTITHVPVPLEAVRAHNETLGAMLTWLNEYGYPDVDIPALRAIHPPLLTLKDWLNTGAAERLRALVG
jgi:uncharacterized protein YbjT (DUF2867 family)